MDFDLPEDSRPAVVDGKLMWVPVPADENRRVPPEGRFKRWNALAAAVLAQAAFDEVGFTREPPIDLG
jgi:hypothetical protein